MSCAITSFSVSCFVRHFSASGGTVVPFLKDLIALLNGSVAIVGYTQCNNPQCPCGRWDSRTNMRNSGGNALVQPSKRVLEQGRLRRPERFFAVVAHGAFPQEMPHAQQRQKRGRASACTGLWPHTEKSPILESQPCAGSRRPV